MASPLTAPMWRFESPLQLLQFPWRWLLPATLIMVPALTDARVRRVAGLASLVAPSLLMVWIQWVRVPDVTVDQQWNAVGSTLYESLGANPLVVDAAQNRPASFNYLARNLLEFGESDARVVSGVGMVVAVNRWSPLRRQIEVIGDTPITVGFRILDYPYWSISTDALDAVPVGGMEGVVVCRLPAGRHVVDVEWTGNPLAGSGQIVAVITVLVLVLGRWRWGGVALS